MTGDQFLHQGVDVLVGSGQLLGFLGGEHHVLDLFNLGRRAGEAQLPVVGIDVGYVPFGNIQVRALCPQVAEKMNLPQVTYAEEIVGVEGDELVIRRRLEHGIETVACRMPLVMTVNGSAAECRPRHAKLVMKCKYAKTASEMQEAQEDYTDLRSERPYLNINEWSVADIDADDQQLGLTGSPTKVKKIDNVVFAAKEAKRLTADDRDIDSLMQELIASHTLG